MERNHALFQVAPDQEPYVLAEIAGAHNGNFGQLLTLIEAVKGVGARGIKFQWFQADTLATPDYEWYPVYKTLAFNAEQWSQAVHLAGQSGLEIWVNVGDEWALAHLQTCHAKVYGLKVPPGILLDRRMMDAVLAFGKPTILGVGGYDDRVIDPLIDSLKDFRSLLILEHGFQGYPTKPEDAMLRRINWLKSRHGLPVGFADHEAGDSELALRLPEYAYFAGADLIEKHICLNRAARPHDYYSSLEPAEFGAMVANLRHCRVIMGGTEIGEEQRKYLGMASRAVLRNSVRAGETIALQDVMYRRTSDKTAMMPDVAERTMPAVAVRDLSAGDRLHESDCRPHKIVAVVPCRMKSSRLKHKAILPIYGVPSIQRCLMNVMAIKRLHATVLATSTHPDDAVLESHAREVGAGFLRGSEEDVLQRILEAASRYGADILLRITGDCPVASFEIAEYMIQAHLSAKADASRCQPPCSVGTFCDVYQVSALRRLRELMPSTPHSEYLMMYFWNNPKHFTVNQVTLPKEYQHPEWRLTLDEQADLDLFNRMFSELDIGREAISFERIAEFFGRHPDAALINAGVKGRYEAVPGLRDKLLRLTAIADPATSDSTK